METLFFSVHLLGIGKKRRIKLGVLRNQQLASFARSQPASVTARMAQFWLGGMEEEQDCIVPMVQTGIGSALINENHVLAKEEAVELK